MLQPEEWYGHSTCLFHPFISRLRVRFRSPLAASESVTGVVTLFARRASGMTSGGTFGGSGRHVLKPHRTLWVSSTHHIIFSLGFALQRLGYRIINKALWLTPLLL